MSPKMNLEKISIKGTRFVEENRDSNLTQVLSNSLDLNKLDDGRKILIF